MFSNVVGQLNRERQPIWIALTLNKQSLIGLD